MTQIKKQASFFFEIMYILTPNKFQILFGIMIFLSSLSANTDKIKDPYKNIIYMKLENGLQAYILSDKKSVNT